MILPCEIVCGFVCIKNFQALVLLHDAHEAYTGDIVTGMKPMIRGLSELQDKLDRAIFAKLGLTPPTDFERKVIKILDVKALLGEARMLLPANGFEYIKRCYHIYEPPEFLPEGFVNSMWAERAFRDKLLPLLEG